MQALVEIDTEPGQVFSDFVPEPVGRHQDAEGQLRVSSREASGLAGDIFELLVAAAVFAEQDLALGIGRILLRVPGIGGRHVLAAEAAVSHLQNRMVVTGPVDEMVGDVDDAPGTAPRDRHLHRVDFPRFQESPQARGFGGGEAAHDRLVGIPYANPVAVLP